MKPAFAGKIINNVFGPNVTQIIARFLWKPQKNHKEWLTTFNKVLAEHLKENGYLTLLKQLEEKARMLGTTSEALVRMWERSTGKQVLYIIHEAQGKC